MTGADIPPRQAFRALRIIFYALNAGLLLFFFMAIYVNDMKLPEFKSEVDVLTMVNVLLLIMIPVGYTLSARKMATINPKDPFFTKFGQYQTAMILRWAMIEGVALLSLVGMIVLEDAKQLVIFLICIFVLSSNAVTREKATKGAQLNPEESRALEG